MADVPLPIDCQQRITNGKTQRKTVARSALGLLPASQRNPLGIIDEQNATRVPDLIPLRTQRMGVNPFTFYRGTAALMAADLAAGPSSDISVASCGDAHVSNFGFYASPQRTLVFDLNDFDEAAWAPWEWDVKRLVTSVIIAGQATSRAPETIEKAATSAINAYIAAMRESVQRSPLARFYEHFDAAGNLRVSGKSARKAVKAAVASARKRTGERAASRMLAIDESGTHRFIDNPPTLVHVNDEVAGRIESSVASYLATLRSDIHLLIGQYQITDTARRVVGVGSVGTRCYVSAFADGDGHILLLQTKEARPSVLIQYGGCVQPEATSELIAESGNGARVVSLQRILQGVSDPLLGYLRGIDTDFYVRQFRDMKGGIDAEALDDASFTGYASACGAVLARAHAQSPTAANVVGYIGGGRRVREAIVNWSYAYAELSRTDFTAFSERT